MKTTSGKLLKTGTSENKKKIKGISLIKCCEVTQYLCHIFLTDHCINSHLWLLLEIIFATCHDYKKS